MRKDSFEKLIRDCIRCLNNTVDAEPVIHGSFIVFGINTEKNNYKAVYESAAAILDIISTQSEEIHEYSMMLLSGSEEVNEKYISEIKQKYYIECEDSALLIDRKAGKAAGLKDDELEINPAGYFTVRSDADSDICASGRENKIIPDEEKINELIELLVPEIDTENTVENIVLRSNSHAQLFETVDAAFAGISKNNDAEYLLINVLPDEQDIIMPFRRSINPGFVEEAEEYLSGIELAAWKELSASLLGRFFRLP